MSTMWGSGSSHRNSSSKDRVEKNPPHGESERTKRKRQLKGTFERLITFITTEESYKDGISQKSMSAFLVSLYAASTGHRSRPIFLPIGKGYDGEPRIMYPDGFKVESGPRSVTSDMASDCYDLDLKVTEERLKSTGFTVAGAPNQPPTQTTGFGDYPLPSVPESINVQPSPARPPVYNFMTSRLDTPSVQTEVNNRFSTNATKNAPSGNRVDPPLAGAADGPLRGWDTPRRMSGARRGEYRQRPQSQFFDED